MASIEIVHLQPRNLAPRGRRGHEGQALRHSHWRGGRRQADALALRRGLPPARLLRRGGQHTPRRLHGNGVPHGQAPRRHPAPYALLELPLGERRAPVFPLRKEETQALRAVFHRTADSREARPAAQTCGGEASPCGGRAVACGGKGRTRNPRT